MTWTKKCLKPNTGEAEAKTALLEGLSRLAVINSHVCRDVDALIKSQRP